MNSLNRLPKKQLEILTTVGTWGYLTTREIALLVWPSITPKAALKSAQLATAELKKEGLLLGRELPVNGRTNAYVLTRKGASLLNDELLQLCFTDGYDIEINRQPMRFPVVALAQVWAREKGFGTVGPRGLAHNAWELSGFRGLDALIVDPDTLTPAFGIMLVRRFDQTAVDKVVKLSRLSVPLLLAATEDRAKTVEALATVRAKAAPAHEEHLQWNKPLGLLC